MKPKLEATAAYENAHLVAHDLLQRIGEQLHDMPAPEGETHINWGHVGDVLEVNNRLADIVALLGGTF